MDRRIPYIQIDYLRLFRLARQQGLINRKRKMPVEYNNYKRALLACSNLFKTFVVKLFDSYEVFGKLEYFRVEIPRHICRTLNRLRTFSIWFETHNPYIYRSLIELFFNGYISTTCDYIEIRVSRFCYYEVAKQLLDFKQQFAEILEFTKDPNFFEDLELKVKLVRNNPSTPPDVPTEVQGIIVSNIDGATIGVLDGLTTQRVEELRTQTQRIEEDRSNQAQSLFDNALARYRP